MRADISKVRKVDNKKLLVFRYEFITNYQEEPIYVYDLESLRYGLISKKRRNASFVGYQLILLLKLCQNVQMAERRYI